MRGWSLLWLLMLATVAPLTNLNAQETWSLDRCLEWAQDHNLQLRQQQIQTTMARERLTHARLQGLPVLEANVSQSFRFGRSVDPLTYQFNNEKSLGAVFTTASQFNLFRGFTLKNQVELRRLQLMLTLKEYEEAQNNLALEVTRLFLQSLFANEMLQLAEEQVILSREQLRITSAMVSSGAITLHEQLGIEAQLAREELNEVEARNEVVFAKLELIELLDIGDSDHFELEKPVFEAAIPETPPEISANELLALVSELPEIQAASLHLDMVKRELAIARGKALPSLAATGYWGTGYSDRIFDFQNGQVMALREQLAYTSTAQLGFQLKIPIFNGYGAQSDIKLSKLLVEQTSLKLEEQKKHRVKEILKLNAEVMAARDKLDATGKSVKAGQENFRIARQYFNAGLLNNISYTEAKNNLSAAKSEHLQALYNYIFTGKILKFYLGMPISSDH